MGTNTPRLAVITGASRGLGRAMALALADAGYELALTARRAEALEEVAARAATPVRSYALDVREAAQVEAFAANLRTDCGAIDLLVNNAGIMGGECGFEQIRPELWQQILATNLTGPYLCCHFLLPLLRRRAGSCIVNVSSGAAVRTGFLNLAYGVSKAGLDRLTLGLADELKDEGVACMSLSPPASATETVRRIYTDRNVDAWAAPPELTALALLRMLELGPQRFSGQVLSVREFLRAYPTP